MLVLLSGCGTAEEPAGPAGEPEQPAEAEAPAEPAEPEEKQMGELYLKIGEEPVEVRWEENESVSFLKDYVKEEALSADLSMYGGFEQVGSLGVSVPRNDVQTVTESGDIVLYSGNQIVIFYGSNSWSYTRLGHIENKSPSEMKELLGNGDVTVTLYTE